MLQASMLSERKKVSTINPDFNRHLLQEIKRKSNTITGQVTVRSEPVLSQQLSNIANNRGQPSNVTVPPTTIPIIRNNGP